MKRIILIFIAIVSFSFIEEKVDQDAIDLKSSYVFREGSNSFRNHRGIIKFKSGSVKIINGVLKSADFFEVAAYPTAKFVITFLSYTLQFLLCFLRLMEVIFLKVINLILIEQILM